MRCCATSIPNRIVATYLRLELCDSSVEAPGAVVEMERVVVAADELDRPAGLPLLDEDHIARRRRLGLTPVGHVGVQHEVALRPPRLPTLVGGAEGLVAL